MKKQAKKTTHAIDGLMERERKRLDGVTQIGVAFSGQIKQLNNSTQKKAS